MSENAPEFTSLMQRVAQRDNEAIAELLHQYNDLLLSSLRGRLRRQPLLRTLFDAEWIANGIWADLLRDPAKCRQFAAPDPFVYYLRGMARNQVRKAARGYLDAQKRDLRRRRHLSDAAASVAAVAVADRRPTPAQVAEDLDDWDHWLLSMSEEESRLVLLLRAGFSNVEIAEVWRCSARSIERRMVDLRYSLHGLVRGDRWRSFRLAL